MQAYSNFKENYSDNTYAINQDIASLRIFYEVMVKQRNSELKSYIIVSEVEALKLTMQDTLKRILKM